MPAAVRFLLAWDPAPVPVLGSLAAAAGYLLAVRALRAAGGAWPARRTAAFLGGLALLLLVLVGPVGAWDGTFFWAHMVQHIATMMVAAPLLLLGAPVLLLLRVLRPDVRRRVLVPVLRSRAVRLLTRPDVTWVVFAAVLLGTHFTPFYDFALTHAAVHEYVEHPMYLAAGLLYFAPLVGANPLPRRPSALVKVLSLLAMMLPESMTGFFIYTARDVLYPGYVDVARPFGPGPLADQQLGGGLMWSSAMVVGATWVVIAAQQWLREDARATERLDRQLAAEVGRAAAP